MMQYQSDPSPTADNEQEWRTLLDSDDPRVIRSREDWDRAMADEGRRSSILPNCDDETVRAFSERLVFRNGGLAAANFTMVEDTLTYREFTMLWNNFGVSNGLMTDYLNKRCDGAHTCVPSTAGDVCTSNC